MVSGYKQHVLEKTLKRHILLSIGRKKTNQPPKEHAFCVKQSYCTETGPFRVENSNLVDTIIRTERVGDMKKNTLVKVIQFS